MKTALLVIATGEKYWKYAERLIDSAKEHFTYHDTILWTDCSNSLGADYVFSKKALGYPDETLYRYHTFLEYKRQLEAYENLFFCDADMLFVNKVGEEIFSDGLVGTLHPGFVNTVGTPERRPESMACIPHNAQNKYFCGGFQGGDSRIFLNAAAELAWRIDEDKKRGVVAVWNDESHWSRLLYERPPAKILGPEYCYPDVRDDYYRNKWKAAGLGDLKPKILALTKEPR